MAGLVSPRRSLPGFKTANFLMGPHMERERERERRKKRERSGERKRERERGRGTERGRGRERGFPGISSYKDTDHIGSGPHPYELI